MNLLQIVKDQRFLFGYGSWLVQCGVSPEEAGDLVARAHAHLKRERG